MCFKWFIKQKYDITPPEPLTDLDFNTLQMLIRAEFPDAQVYLSDSYYKTTTIDELKRFLAFDKTSEEHYISEWYDCDDFAAVTNGTINIPGWYWLPFGIMWTETPGGGHAVNVFVDNLNDIYIVEPQTDAIYSLPGNWRPYLIII